MSQAIRQSVLVCICLLWAARAQSAAVDRLGPFRLVAADGTSSLQLGFGVQLVGMETFEQEKAPSSDQFELEFRRIRLSLASEWGGGALRSRVQFSLTPQSPELVDAWADVAMGASRLRVGQFTVPFTGYRQRGYSALYFADWSSVSRNFGAERQIGVMVHEGGVRRGGLEWAVALTMGENARASHAIGVARGMGVRVSSPSLLTDGAPYGTPHPEVVMRVGWGTAGVDTELWEPTPLTPVNWAVRVSAAFDAQPRRTQDFAWRAAPELDLRWGRFSATVAGYFGWIRTEGDSIALGLTGGLAELDVYLGCDLALGLRYSRIDYWSVVAKQALLLVGDLEGTAPASARAAYDNELAAALSWLAVGQFAKVVVDVSWQRATWPRGLDAVDAVRLQLVLHAAM